MHTLTANPDYLLVGDAANQDKGEDHPYLLVDGKPYHTGRVGIDPRCSAFHYALGDISGYGAWNRPSDKTRWAFRQVNQMWRVLQNARAIPVRGELPDLKTLLEWSLLGLGMAIPHLTQAEDVYGRTSVIQGAVALGVGSRGNPHIVQISRDLTEYVPPTGLALLMPGMLLRRSSPFIGRPTEKSVSNYSLAHLWKVIANELGYDEVLMLNWNGDEVAESSGSIPICIYHLPNRRVRARFSRFGSWRLNSITLDTNAYLMRRLGWEVIDDQPMLFDHLCAADEIWVAGSWSGLAPVTRFGYDPNFLTGEPNVPEEVFADGVGDAYYQWIMANFKPRSAGTDFRFSAEPGHQGLKLKQQYWGVVRNDPAFYDIERPPEWNLQVHPAKVR